MKANVFDGLYSHNCLEMQYPWISRQVTTEILHQSASVMRKRRMVMLLISSMSSKLKRQPLNNC